MKLDLERLRGAIRNKKEMAQQVGISRTAFYDKLNETTEFSVREFLSICEVLKRAPTDFILYDKSEIEKAA